MADSKAWRGAAVALGGALALALTHAWAGGYPARAYHAPRNAYGAPDLGGAWTNDSLTRLQRPAGVTALVVSGPDVADARRKLSAVYEASNDGVGGRESEWWDAATLGQVDGQLRTSWIVEPADGKLPYTPQGQALADAHIKAQTTAFDGPEARNPAERCLLPSWGAIGPPILNAPYNANYEIVQTRDQLAILSENNSALRIIRIGPGADHLPPQIRPWTGDSVGRWAGETLVVETTNFRADDASRPGPFYPGLQTKVVERFTRISPTALKYEFTVEDPTVFARPWRAEMPFTQVKATLYEFACHEGNYSMTGILGGARAIERAQAAATPTK